ncbi:MAG: hybrid sensor histidine kinase/response regulator [Thermosynechococcaceae cyanobacterium MS004]|nr:hybrid sensor histidine kinase/response regulator [Thermosynechococcaceae cyanobacterium MS004]
MTATNPSIRDQAYQFFQQEALDLLQSLEDGLLNLRSQYDIPHVHDLMRAAHSIKGGASSVGLPGIEKIAHKLEDVFRALYRRTDPPDADLEEALLQAYDCLRLPLLEQLNTGQFDDGAAWAKAEPIFTLLEAVFQLEIGADVELPTAAELGVDIVYEVFSGDVQRGIDRLTEVLQHPEVEPLAGEIRATAEVFVGIGDLLGLAGFSAIAQATLQALDCHPEQALTIGQLTIESLQAAQVGVLEGDRTHGGSPSPALLALAQPSLPADLDHFVLPQPPAEHSTEHSLDAQEDTHFEFQRTNLENLYDAASFEGLELPIHPEIPDALAFGHYASTPEPVADSGESALEGFADPSALEDIFGESAVEDSSALEDIFGESAVEDSSALEDIFGESAVEDSSALENILGESAVEDSSALEDIFGESAVEDSSVLEDIFGQSAFEPEESSSPAIADSGDVLEDIFGSASLDLDSIQDWSTFPAAAEVMPTERDADPIPSPSDDLVVPSPQDSPSEPEAATTSAAKDQPKPSIASNAYMTDSVRVDFMRLERLNNLVGELVTHENGSLLQSQQLQATLQRLQQRFLHFEDLSKNLQTWMDQSLQSDVSSQFSDVTRRSFQGTQNPDLASLADFDPLQMDSYSGLYTMLQEALEEIAQMGETIGDISLLTQQSQQIQRKKQQTLKQVRNDLLWARMIPLGDILNRFPRMVRDLATKHDKQVIFKQYGATTLVDKAILEKLYDPLVHLIRNAFDHGTESAAERLAQNKPPAATIEVRAYHRGNQTLIEVRDDGRGIDPDNIRTTAIAQGLLTPAEAEAASTAQLYKCLFEPSFSTAAEVSDLSGRGMGMSAVMNQVQTLKGNIAIASEVGKGTTFTLSLPLTLTIAKLLVFSAENHTLAIPVDSLLSIVAASEKEIESRDGQRFYRQKDRTIPLYSPSTFVYHYPLPKGFAEKSKVMALPQEGKVPLLLIASGKEVIALEVDQVLDEQELVIKPFGTAGTPPKYLYGCAILGDGSLVPVMDGAALFATQQDLVLSGTGKMPAIAAAELPVMTQSQTILVVDDSLTTRQNVTLTLQKFGYQVVQAGDGKEALEKLRQDSTIQAVFSDVEMPTMNGFEFLSTCRKSYSAAALPIIMLTSRSSDKHRGIAKLLGANHYLTKPYLEQDLLKSLQACLAEGAQSNGESPIHNHPRQTNRSVKGLDSATADVRSSEPVASSSV